MLLLRDQGSLWRNLARLVVGLVCLQVVEKTKLHRTGGTFEWFFVCVAGHIMTAKIVLPSKGSAAFSAGDALLVVCMSRPLMIAKSALSSIAIIALIAGVKLLRSISRDKHAARAGTAASCALG